jgi:DNA invertase Pin-like site-specific DNA recombinase
MNERAKITAQHLARQAIVYLRQSSAAQVEHNRESTERQYALAAKARELGWPEDRILIIDEDLGLSGSGSVARSGFARLTAEVALARVGLVLGLEVSRLARNNADWHRLIDLAGLTDTLIGDGDGIYHPALFNDRLLLGLKGTMSEAELHVLRARLNGGIRNKAARGELRRGLPTGFVWGEADGEVLLHPDEAVVTAIRTVFDRFAEMGSARRVWLWFRDRGLKLPRRRYPASTLQRPCPSPAQSAGSPGVGGATSDRYGLPPITRSTLTSVPCPLPRRIETGACADCFPIPRGLPRYSGGSASATSLSRPAQASLALRPTGSLNRPRRPLSQGSGPSSYPHEPLASYQINRQLSGWNLPPLVLRAVGAHRIKWAKSSIGPFVTRNHLGQNAVAAMRHTAKLIKRTMLHDCGACAH